MAVLAAGPGHESREIRPAQTGFGWFSNRRSVFRALFTGRLARQLHHLINHPLEILQAGGRYDDVVAAAANVFRDAQKAPPRIFLEREHERLALNLYFLRP